MPTSSSPSLGSRSPFAPANGLRPPAGAPGHTPRRVLHVEMNEDHTVGGSYQALYDLVRLVDRSRYEPVVLFYQDNVFAERLRQVGIEVHLFEEERAQECRAHRSGRLWPKIAVRFQAVARRVAFLRRHRIDFVHLNDSPRIGADDWLPACRVARMPCITFAMGDAHREPNPVRRWLFARFDRVISISRYVEAAMRQNGVPARRSALVYLGVDADAVRARAVLPREAVRLAHEVPDDVVLAAMVGNIRSWKGQHVVLEALRLLEPAVRKRLRIFFIGATAPGDLEYEAGLRRFVAAHGLEENVHFLGSRTDVPELFRAADFAIHASTIPEPFGLVVVEAMALGCPVVASNAGGPAEVITPDTGLTFDPTVPGQLAAHITRLVSEPALRTRLAQAAPGRAAQFSIASNVAGVVGVYDELLGIAPPRAAAR